MQNKSPRSLLSLDRSLPSRDFDQDYRHLQEVNAEESVPVQQVHCKARVVYCTNVYIT